MVAVSILPRVEFGPNDHREDAPHFTVTESLITWFKDCQLTHLSLIQIYYPDKATEPPLEVKKLKSKKEIEKLKRANIEVIEREPIRIVYHLLIG